MANKKSTKRALMLSTLSLLLCVSMFVGTTFAWFTDSVSTVNNKIVAGNLDVELYWSTTAEENSWKKVDENTNIFKEDTLWEPGHTEVVYLKVKNEGTLALKYQLGVNIASETPGINKDGKVFHLSDYIKFGVANFEEAYDSREEAIADVESAATALKTAYSKSSQLYAEGKGVSEEVVAMVVYMPTTVGNEANYKTGTTRPEINLGINLFATQYTSESDSFGNDYDKDAAWTGAVDTDWYYNAPAGTTEFTLVTAEELAGLAAVVNAGTDDFAGKTVKLGANIDLNNVNWTPIGVDSNKFVGTFIGTGYTISNLRVVGEKALGLFGKTFTGAHIEGVTINKAYVSGNDYVGAILGQGYLGHNCIKNCSVTNATIIATPYFDTDKGVYDGGAKAGVIAGQAYNGNITGCTVKDSTVTAYRDLGGIAGMHDFDGKAGTTVEASGNTVEGVTLSYVGVAGAYDGNKPNQNMAEVIGRVGANCEVGTNTVTNVTMNEANKGAVMIYTLEELIAFAKDVNAGNTYAGKTVILGDDIDLLNMDWTPIGTGAGFNGTFDGNGKTISNLKITGYKSTVGLFANTYNGEIKNLTVKNASVSGRLNVGVVAGNPYTSKYTNITVTGHVEVNGMSYVGGVGGKNAYADWTNVTVNVDETSYVKAISTENGIAYRTYVGGVVGFNGEGGHTFKNITSNIDVIGDVCDIGGAFGIAHYGNNFENITVTGNVTNLISSENDGDDAATDVLETGLIAGVWHNQTGYTVTFKNISATGTISTPNVTPAEDFHYDGLVGKKYSATGTGVITITNYADEDGITYANDVVTGDKTLYLVPSDYEGSTVIVPEGVDSIGNYAFKYNSNVKEVVLSSTVRDLGRGFDESKVEKVVLNDGLTTISSRAFRSTTALKEVVFSSTVTEIADNAFQKSGIKEIVIPANVKTIGETAFGASLIEKVTFEGDIAIQGYAFRGCTKLKTVVMNGYDVTFVKSTLNGRNSMWFCNGESNNPNTSDIDFYVKNEVIKERVLTAMGAERNNTDVVCEQTANENGVYTDKTTGETYAYASDNATLSSAITAEADTVYLFAGEYKMPSSNTTGSVTIAGTKDTVLDVTLGAYLDSSNGVTIEGVTIKTGTGYANGNGSDYAALYAKNVTYINCTFEGPMRVGRDGAKFINCTFTKLGNDYIWTYGNDVTFEGCTFNTNGKAILIYSDGGNEVSKVAVKDCVFNSTNGAKAGAIANQNCAAIEIHNYGNGVNLVTEGNTYDSNFSGEWRIKTYETGKPKVFVNGTEYTQIALDGKLMTIDSNKNVTVQE